MSSFGFNECFSTVDGLVRVFDYGQGQELRKDFSKQDIYQFYDYCDMLYAKEVSDPYSEPMVWIGVYIAIASFFCILAMAADLLLGFRNKKFWFPCKYFSLNATSITVITIAMKLPVDLNSEVLNYMDQAAKVGSLGFMCTMMANLMPSLASMDNKTLLANIIGLCILVITIIVNVCIQIYTGVISYDHIFGVYYYFVKFRFGFPVIACIYMAMILLLLIMMISSCLTIPTSKEILESKYQATNKKSLSHDRLQHIKMSEVEKLRQYLRRYWIMAETGSPQFGMASNLLSTVSGVVCVMVMVMNLLIMFRVMLRFHSIRMPTFDHKKQFGSSYLGSTIIIFVAQSIGVVVGTIAPISRCFSVFSFRLGTKWNRKYFMFFIVEKYWTQKLYEWKQSPVLFLSSSRRLRSLICNSKNIILSFCIGFQMVIVILCKVIRLVTSIFVISCFYCWKSLKAIWFTPPINSRTGDIDENLSNFVLQIDNETELAEKTLKGISKSMFSFISKAEKGQNNNLLELLKNSTGFEGVQIFDIDNVQSLLPAEHVNGWSLPIVTLTCIVVALPNIHKDEVESLIRSVGEGLSFTNLVEESLNCASEYVNIQKTAMILWHEVEHKCKWLDKPLAKNAFKGKTATEIVKWFSSEAKEIMTKINESTDGELAENTPKRLIAANSMYRITQTILLRYQNIEPITKKQLFTHLKGMIADIFSACFTNIPRVITMKCQEKVIEKREASVKVAAKLLGKTTKIIERLETCEVPSMDDEKMAYIDEWRLYLKQTIP